MARGKGGDPKQTADWPKKELHLPGHPWWAGVDKVFLNESYPESPDKQ